MKTYGYLFNERFIANGLYKISFSVPLSEVLKHKDLVITIDGEKFKDADRYSKNLPYTNNLINVERILYACAFDNHFLMEEEFPFAFTSSHYKISKLVEYFFIFSMVNTFLLLKKPKEYEKTRKPFQVRRAVPNFLFYRNYLYISMINGQFLTMFDPYDYVLLVFIKTTINIRK